MILFLPASEGCYELYIVEIVEGVLLGRYDRDMGYRLDVRIVCCRYADGNVRLQGGVQAESVMGDTL